MRLCPLLRYAGLMGLPLPECVRNEVDALKEQGKEGMR